MVEYGRLNNASSGGAMKPGRLRPLPFPPIFGEYLAAPRRDASTKSDDWFFNAFNGKGNTLSVAASDRCFSESSLVNGLLGLDDESVGKATAAGKDAEGQIEGPEVWGNGNSGTNQDVRSVPDSPMLETTLLFGSTSSSPSVANFPPIRVHLEENPKVGALGIEDQFQQMTLGVAANVNFPATRKTEEGEGFMAAGISAGAVAAGVPMVIGGDPRVISDDERSDPLWWMTQRMGSLGQDIPFETQFLIVEERDGAHFGEDEKEQSSLCVVILPILEGNFRAVLQGNANNELEICLESGDPAVQEFDGSHMVFVGAGSDPFDVITNAVNLFGLKQNWSFWILESHLQIKILDFRYVF